MNLGFRQYIYLRVIAVRKNRFESTHRINTGNHSTQIQTDVYECAEWEKWPVSVVGMLHHVKVIGLLDKMMLSDWYIVAHCMGLSTRG